MKKLVHHANNEERLKLFRNLAKLAKVPSRKFQTYKYIFYETITI